MIWLDGQGLGRNTLENWWQGNLGKGYVDKPLQMDPEYENTCVPYEYSPKKDLNNQVNRMIFSVDIN